MLMRVEFHYRHASISAVLIFAIFDLKRYIILSYFSSPLVLLSNLDLHGFCFRIFCLCPLIKSINQGIPLLSFSLTKFRHQIMKKRGQFLFLCMFYPVGIKTRHWKSWKNSVGICLFRYFKN